MIYLNKYKFKNMTPQWYVFIKCLIKNIRKLQFRLSQPFRGGEVGDPTELENSTFG